MCPSPPPCFLFVRVVCPCWQALKCLDAFSTYLRSISFVIPADPDSVARHALPFEEGCRDECGDFALPILHFEGMGTEQAQEAFFERLRTVVEPHAALFKQIGFPKRANNAW